MQYKLSKLSNGLRVLIAPMPSLESVTTIVWVKTGSRNEQKDINGISHFLEHMVFKGSKKRPTAKEISETVDSFGGEFNAGTSKDWTNFYIKARTGSLDTAMDVLSDMVLNPTLDEKEIEREKGTIIQEIAMYNDTPMMKIQDVFEELIFDGNPLSWDVAGIEKTVRNITKTDFLRYRKSYYYPENMLITIAGGVTQKAALDLAEKYFGSYQSPKSTFKGLSFKVNQKSPQLKIRNKKSDQTNLMIGFMGDGRSYKNRYVQSVLSGILNGGMSSRLFIAVRERRGLAYSVKPANDRFEEVGYFGAYAGVSPKNAEEAIKVILDQLFGLRDGRYPITETELKKAKEYIKGHIALSLEDTNEVADFFGSQGLFLPNILTPEEIFDKIDAVTIEDILSESKRLFVPSHLNLAIIGPYTSEEKFRKILK